VLTAGDASDCENLEAFELALVDLNLSGVTERDVDLMMVEELVASQEFRNRFTERIGIGTALSVTSAARSVATSNGESDIEVSFTDGHRTTHVLIENKVDAPLQPSQGERYQARGEMYVEQGEHERVIVVLTAPSRYLSSKRQLQGFDHQVAYEEIREWLNGSPASDARIAYKIALIEAAITRGEIGWVLKPDPTTTEFWREYWILATRMAPELQMPEPDAKPATSGFIAFRPAGLPDGYELLHKLPYGHVDLQIRGGAAQMSSIRATYEPSLGLGMRIERASKSAVIRIPVPKIQFRTSFSNVEAEVREGIVAAQRLLAWYRATEATQAGNQ
jgi:hypothetical protein